MVPCDTPVNLHYCFNDFIDMLYCIISTDELGRLGGGFVAAGCIIVCRDESF